MIGLPGLSLPLSIVLGSRKPQDPTSPMVWCRGVGVLDRAERTGSHQGAWRNGPELWVPSLLHAPSVSPRGDLRQSTRLRGSFKPLCRPLLQTSGRQTPACPGLTGQEALSPGRECSGPHGAVPPALVMDSFLALRVRHPFLGDLKKLITNDFVRQK